LQMVMTATPSAPTSISVLPFSGIATHAISRDLARLPDRYCLFAGLSQVCLELGACKISFLYLLPSEIYSDYCRGWCADAIKTNG
jgi:hypothetical protein